MLGLVVRAAHLPPGPRLGAPARALRPAPGGPGLPSAVNTGDAGATASVSREWLLRADSSPGRGAREPRLPAHPCPPTPASSLGASRDPRMGRGRGRVPLGTKEVLHPAIPQPYPNPGRWRQWRFQNFYVGFRGRHLVGRGLKCLSYSRFEKHWTPDCLIPKEIIAQAWRKMGGLASGYFSPTKISVPSLCHPKPAGQPRRLGAH